MRREFSSFRHLPVPQSPQLFFTRIHLQHITQDLIGSDKLPAFWEDSFLDIQHKEFKKASSSGDNTQLFFLGLSLSYTFRVGTKSHQQLQRISGSPLLRGLLGFLSSCLELPGFDLWLSRRVQRELV